MRRLFSMLRRRSVPHIIGLLAIAALIWFGGPYLGLGSARPLESESARLAAIMFSILIFGAGRMRRQARANKSNKAMLDQMAEPAEDAAPQEDASAEEVALLKARFTQALQQLKQAKFKGHFGSQYLYQLPWYAIIGPPGSGKTTLLENSDLEFPVTGDVHEKKVSGFGGTRNCDWWFTNDAVLLDTAGRYTTQDSHHDADSGAWLGFLNLLRKHRPRRPLNGIIVAISVHDLLGQNSAERDSHAQTIRLRIQELYKQLNNTIPVYLLFTKTDLVAGFSEFFDDLTKEQRAQVFGFTAPRANARKTEDVLTLFGEEYNALIERLNERLLWRLHQERDLSRRGLINGYPQQMADLKPLLLDFLTKTFGASRYEQRPWLRGVYFTSGTQSGSPVDRVMGTLARAFGLNMQASPVYRGYPRSFFIHRFFQGILFAEAELANPNAGYERQRLWLQRGAYAAAILVAFGTIAAWSASFTRNEMAINTLDNRIEEYQTVAEATPTNPSLDDLLSTLDAARDLTTVFGADAADKPRLMGMGLYQGLKLGTAAERAYERVLDEQLLSHIKIRLEDTILRTQEPEDVRRLLSNYFMIGDPDVLDTERFAPWVASEWARIQPNDPDLRARLGNHLNLLMTSGYQARELDEDLLIQAQRVVCEIPLDRQIYARLKQKAESARLPTFELANLGPEARKAFAIKSSGANTVPGFYSYDAYHDIVEKEGRSTTKLTIEENLRVCEHKRSDLEDADADKLMRAVKERYYHDYVEHWNAFLSGIELVNLKNFNQTVDVLGILSGIDSPLNNLAEAVTKQTILDRSGLDNMLERLDSKQRFIERDLDPVEREFQAIHQLLHQPKDNPSALDGLLNQLGELHSYAADIGNASNVSEAAFQAAQSRMGQSGDIIRQLRNESKRLPAPFSGMIESSATQVWGVTLGAARSFINNAWRATVLKEHQSRLENRYPLYRDSLKEATLEDFGQFFSEGGTLDSFIATYLGPFIDTRRWTLRSIDGRNIGISSKALRQLRRAQEIKAMFFAEGDAQPSARFTLKPVFLNAGVRRFILDLDGQSVDYRHGPARTVNLTWPGTTGSGQVRVIFERLGAGSYRIVKDGPWAWFKLLEDSQISRGQSASQINVTFATAGLEARYQLQASSVDNPLTNSDWKLFRCPDRL